MNHYLALACLLIFCGLGVFDGVYFHLIRYKLHLREQSRTEHLLHTARAFVFIPIALIFFAYNAQGALLWAGLGFVGFDLVLEAIDILVERESRRGLGGISSEECAIHVFASSFRMGALAFVLSAKPVAAFGFGGVELFGPDHPLALEVAGLAFALFSGVGGLGSLLATRPQREEAGVLREQAA